MLGNTTMGDVNTTRVNSNLIIKRPLNMRTNLEHEVGPILTRFVRRDLFVERTLFGPIRNR